MAFVRSASPRYFAPATLSTLSEDGLLIASKFDCQFKRLKRTELADLRRKTEEWGRTTMDRIRAQIEAVASSASGKPGGAEPAQAARTDALEDMVSRKAMVEVMVGWRAVQAPDGSELPFSLAAMDQTEEEFPGFINACADAFWSSCTPREAAHLAAKN